MPDWVEKSLGSVFKVKHGFAFKGEFFTDSPQRYALVTPGNFAVGGGFQSQKQKYYSGPVPDEYVLKPGSVVVTMTDLSKQSDTLGYAALVPDDGTTWLHNQRVGLLEFYDLDHADPVFFSYLMRTHAYRAWIVGSATGTTVKHTAPSRIESFQCLVPTVEVQRQIASMLKSLDDKIDLNRRINQTLEAMAQAIFKSWFVDFDLVKAKIAAIQEGRDPLRAAMSAISGRPDAELDALPREQFDQLAATAALFPDEMEESALGEIPRGWTFKSVCDVAQFASGKVDVSSLSQDIYISTENMLENRAGVTRAASLPSVPTVPSFAAGQVLVSNIRPYFKKIWLARFDGGRSPDVLAFVSTNPQRSEFLYNLLYQDSFFEFMTRTAKGAKMPRGDKDAILGWKFPCPDEFLMAYYSEKAKSYYAHIESLTSESKSLAELRDTLLPKLLSGELPVAALVENSRGA